MARTSSTTRTASARYMPAGVRVLEASLLRRLSGRATSSCCYPDDLDKFIGPDTRVVAVSTHNPLGVTFAAGVYTSIFGSSKQPINSHYARELFATHQGEPVPRSSFKVIVGGSGGWQITQTNTWDELSVDCVVEGRSESADTMELFDKAIRGEDAAAAGRRRRIRRTATSILVPDKRTTFGVVEMTTGCGRRCQFCVPDLNPQIDVPKDQIMAAVRANVRDGNKQISLATEDMFIWGQVHTDTPFYFPEPRSAARSVRDDRQHARRRAARAQPRDDRAGRRRSGADREAIGRAARQEPDPICPCSARIRRSGRSCRSSASRPARCGWPSRSCRARACRSRSTNGRASSSAGSRC